MTVSWIILTYNRGETVKRSVTHNFDCAGYVPEELIWVDNGSTDGIVRPFMASMDPEVSVLNNENLGVAKGYNRGLGLATKDYIVITGCDMLMPNNWLKTFLEYMDRLPGIACIYSRELATCPERIRGNFAYDPLPHIPALALERRIFPRRLLADIGYFPETFGLYGYDDLAWAMRAEKICTEQGLGCYVIPHLIAEHLGTEGVEKYDGRDGKDYHEFKRREAGDVAKRTEFERLRRLGWPRFSPYP